MRPLNSGTGASPRCDALRLALIDDAPLLRLALRRALSRRPEVCLVGAVDSLEDLRGMLLAEHPDAILLHIGAVRVNPLSLIRQLREHYPVPILVIAGPDAGDRRRALRAVECGALEVLEQPAPTDAEGWRRLCDTLVTVLPGGAGCGRPPRFVPSKLVDERPSFRVAGLDPRRYLIVVGASTGGTEALRVLLANIGCDFPPIAIVQHMPASFTSSFAQRLNRYCPASVREAVQGQPLVSGQVVVARGDTHLTVQAGAGGFACRYTNQVPVSLHCPSVDVLFDSAVAAAGNAAVGVLLTGMGADGAAGLLRLRRAGALTIAQDAGSCTVFGMPKAAGELGAVQFSAAPDEIPQRMLDALRNRGGSSSRSRMPT